MGVMTSELSPAAEDFVAHARDARRPLLEVGAAYGNATLARCATEAGFTIETLEYFCFRNFPDQHRTDGREYVTMTARKPE